MNRKEIVTIRRKALDSLCHSLTIKKLDAYGLFGFIN